MDLRHLAEREDSNLGTGVRPSQRFSNSLLRNDAQQSQLLTVAPSHQNSPNVTSFVNFRTPLGTVNLRSESAVSAKRGWG
jgi:hypothetical protein